MQKTRGRHRTTQTMCPPSAWPVVLVAAAAASMYKPSPRPRFAYGGRVIRGRHCVSLSVLTEHAPEPAQAGEMQPLPNHSR